MSLISTTLRYMEQQAAKHGEVVVAYSGGKDSLVVMDLACRTFPKVRAFFKYLIPNLEYCEEWMRFSKDRWGVEVIQFPHEMMLESLANGVWCNANVGLAKGIGRGGLPLKLSFAYAFALSGSPICATGMKDADGLKRRQFFSNIRDGGDPIWNRVIHPIRGWRKKDVIDYLTVQKIPLPKQERRAVTSGVGLGHTELCWLHDDYPEDFKKLLRFYPYAYAAIKRREWFPEAVA